MLRYLVFVFVAVASADVIGDGPCPEAKVVENFDFSAFAGTWYEIAKFPNIGEDGRRGKCTTAEYTVEGDRGKVKNSHVINGVKSSIGGGIKLTETGDIMITYNFGPHVKNSYLKILNTDYKNYAIGYSCKFFEKNNNHQVFSWILSRGKTLEGESKAAVDSFLASSKILDTSKYVYNDYSDEACKFTETKAITDYVRKS